MMQYIYYTLENKAVEYKTRKMTHLKVFNFLVWLGDKMYWNYCREVWISPDIFDDCFMIMEVLTSQEAVPGDQSSVKYWYCNLRQSRLQQPDKQLSEGGGLAGIIIFVWSEQTAEQHWLNPLTGGEGGRGQVTNKHLQHPHYNLLVCFPSPLLCWPDQSSPLTSAGFVYESVFAIILWEFQMDSFLREDYLMW